MYIAKCNFQMFLCYLEYYVFIKILLWFLFHKQTFHGLILDVYHLITAGKTNLHYYY